MKVSLNLPEWLVVRLKERATQERRSLSQTATLLLERQLLADEATPPRAP
jgi:hypothetical protein